MTDQTIPITITDHNATATTLTDIDAIVVETGVSPADRNRAAMQLAERKPSLMALRADELIVPGMSAERALELSAHIQTLARDLAGPFPFQADFYNEVQRLAQSALLDDALVFYAAAGALEGVTTSDEREGDDPATDLWRRAYTYWAVAYEKVVRVGRYFAEVPSTWPRLTEVRAVVLQGS